MGKLGYKGEVFEEPSLSGPGTPLVGTEGKPLSQWWEKASLSQLLSGVRDVSPHCFPGYASSRPF